jgi:uncharacterized protein with FMN-binding domain
MKSSIRYPAFVMSAAAIAAAATIGSAAAAGWLPSALLSRLTGESSRPPAATAPAGRDPAAATDPPTRLAAGNRYRDGSFTGPAYDTYYGPVQVQVNVQDGRVVSVDVPQYPADRRASQRINSRALPMLEREVISAQSARVNIISGATLTCEAYLRSLNAALGDAGAGSGI